VVLSAFEKGDMGKIICRIRSVDTLQLVPGDLFPGYEVINIAPNEQLDTSAEDQQVRTMDASMIIQQYLPANNCLIVSSR
jgi:hypothetical protein